jgi:hypothetical protein
MCDRSVAVHPIFFFCKWKAKFDGMQMMVVVTMCMLSMGSASVTYPLVLGNPNIFHWVRLSSLIVIPSPDYFLPGTLPQDVEV